MEAETAATTVAMISENSWNETWSRDNSVQQPDADALRKDGRYRLFGMRSGRSRLPAGPICGMLSPGVFHMAMP